MNKEAKRELDDQANQLAYDFIKHSGLHKALATNEDHDRLATEWAKEVYELLERKVNEKFTELEAKKEEVAA